MSAKVIRCQRCNRRQRNPDGWNIVMNLGFVSGYLCPDCQTAEEYTEAVLNEATMDYGKVQNIRMTPDIWVAAVAQRSHEVLRDWAREAGAGGVREATLDTGEITRRVVASLPPEFFGPLGDQTTHHVGEIVAGVISGDLYEDGRPFFD